MHVHNEYPTLCRTYEHQFCGFAFFCPKSEPISKSEVTVRLNMMFSLREQCQDQSFCNTIQCVP